MALLAAATMLYCSPTEARHEQGILPGSPCPDARFLNGVSDQVRSDREAEACVDGGSVRLCCDFSNVGRAAEPPELGEKSGLLKDVRIRNVVPGSVCQHARPACG
jgi:hypothetical protein